MIGLNTSQFDLKKGKVKEERKGNESNNLSDWADAYSLIYTWQANVTATHHTRTRQSVAQQQQRLGEEIRGSELEINNRITKIKLDLKKKGKIGY